MAINDDLPCAATLCANAADAATTKLIALGARPSADVAAAAAWDAQDTLLKNKISTLNNLASSISALIVWDALASVWPNLIDLKGVAASAQANILQIEEVSKAMLAIASVINFGVAVVTLATQPSVSNAESVVADFTALTAFSKPTA